MDQIVMVIPSAEEIQRMTREMRNYEQPRLRWVVLAETTTEGPRLQEGIPWRSSVAAGIEWRDVPTVVLPPLS